MFNKFWKNKRVLITGHTGFMGSWLCLALSIFGAKIIGISLKPKTNPNLFSILNLKKKIFKNFIFDIKNKKRIETIIKKYKPEVVYHLAAEALVRKSYLNPEKTYHTNIIGTVNIFEALTKIKKKITIIIVTSDKCYLNIEKNIKYDENSPLGGKDPYSSSKSCQDIISQSYLKTILSKKNSGYIIARLGNIIGGGDWSKDRLIPDVIRSLYKKKKLYIRNPRSIRPWQHVVETTYYLIKATYKVRQNIKLSGEYNFGPDNQNHVDVKEIITLIKKKLANKNLNLKTISKKTITFSESQILKLNNLKMKKNLKLKPKMSLKQSIDMTIDWYLKYKNKSLKNTSELQILEYFNKR